MKLRPDIGTHDLAVKVRKMREMLTDGFQVQVSVIMRGRENRHPEVSARLIQAVLAQLADVGKFARPPVLEGRSIGARVVPV